MLVEDPTLCSYWILRSKHFFLPCYSYFVMNNILLLNVKCFKLKTGRPDSGMNFITKTLLYFYLSPKRKEKQESKICKTFHPGWKIRSNTSYITCSRHTDLLPIASEQVLRLVCLYIGPQHLFSLWQNNQIKTQFRIFSNVGSNLISCVIYPSAN